MSAGLVPTAIEQSRRGSAVYALTNPTPVEIQVVTG